MRIKEYKEAKLKIYERCAAGLVTESQRDSLLQLLEEKKGEDLTPESIGDFFDQLKDKYTDLEDEIDNLQTKIKKIDNKEGSNDGDDEVSEAAMDLMKMIDNLI